MKHYEAVIGLEIHVAMNTRSKMFSSAPNGYSKNPNTQVAPFDLAHPGTLPRINKAAVRSGIRVASALHMDIDRLLRFDRKNYFYPDLPKGYQITQQFHPLGQNGYLEILDKDGETRRIDIKRLHLEEDTCKSLHFSDHSLLDFNRAGVPLLEIVSAPQMRDGVEAARFVETIRNIVVYALVSDGKMEDGSLRCDVNVSLKDPDADLLGPRVEIKNLNSLKNIALAVDYEIQRQCQLLEEGKTIRQTTRRYDEATGTTKMMRVKTAEVDYHYFPEPNLLPVRLSEEFIAEAIQMCPELYEAKKQRYVSLGLSVVDAEIILSELALSRYYDAALGDGSLAKIVASLLLVEVRAHLNRTLTPIQDLTLPPKTLFFLAKCQKEGYTHKQVVDMLNHCLAHPGLAPIEAASALGLEKPSDDLDRVTVIVRETLDANPQSIADYKAGKNRALGFLVGQALKWAQGTLNPSSVAKIMEEELKRR